MRYINPSWTITELLRIVPGAAATLGRMGIDTCCGGGVALAVAAERDGVELPVLLARLEQVSERA